MDFDKILNAYIDASDFDQFHENTLKNAIKVKGASKHALKSSIRYIFRAHQLKNEMPEIAAFCAITAEEEVATAIFHALKKKKYDGAKRLNSRNHVHKTAVLYFIKSCGSALKNIVKSKRFFVQFHEIGECSYSQKVLLGVRISIDGELKEVLPDPPLSFLLNENPDNDSLLKDKIVKIIENASKSGSVEKSLRELANERNKILYAGEAGIPVVLNVDQFLSEKENEIFNLIIIFLFIEHYPSQKFVQFCLDNFFHLLESARILKGTSFEA